MGWPNNPRPARSLVVLGAECDTEFPGRDRSSEGLIGDTRHQKESSSDHNPWVTDSLGRGVVRARDVDAGPGLNPDETHDLIGDVVAEAALAGLRTHFGLFKIFRRKFAPMGPGAYVIWERRIASHKTKGAWVPYFGTDPHESHPHVSVALAQSGYDDGSSWGIHRFADVARGIANPSAKQHPVTLTRTNWKSHRLLVRKLQRRLNELGGPKLTVDGEYGARTAERVALFKKRRGFRSRTGWVVGPTVWKGLGLW